VLIFSDQAYEHVAYVVDAEWPARPRGSDGRERPASKKVNQPLPCRRRRLIALGSQPGYSDIGVPAEKHDQLTGVVLSVSQVIEKELTYVQVVPRETTALESQTVSQLLKRFVALPEAVIGVRNQLDPGEGPLRTGDDPTELLVVPGQKHRFVYVEVLQREFFRHVSHDCLERLRTVRQVEVGVEKCMVGQVPERRAMGAVVPQIVRTGLDG
jgi:hypothetical protein